MEGRYRGFDPHKIKPYPEEAALELRSGGKSEWTRGRRMEIVSEAQAEKPSVGLGRQVQGTQKRTSMATTQIVDRS